MRWASCRQIDGTTQLGLVCGDEIRITEEPVDLVDVLDAGPEALQELGRSTQRRPDSVVPLDAADLDVPLRPRSVRDFLGFLDHMRRATGSVTDELDRRWTAAPGFYFGNSLGVLGPHDPVEVFPGSAEFDFELEVAAVVGSRGRDLTSANAESAIAGYTIMCDWSARDLQRDEMVLGLGPAKGKDGATTLGPFFVSADELEHVRTPAGLGLMMRAGVNGRDVGQGRLDQMDWSFGDMLAHASRGVTLLPGEVIGSGTVPTGCLVERHANGDESVPWLRPGDVVDLEVEVLGGMSLCVVAPSTPRTSDVASEVAQ